MGTWHATRPAGEGEIFNTNHIPARII